MSLWPPRFTSLTSSSSGNTNRPSPTSPPRLTRDQQQPPLSPRGGQSSSPRQQPHTRAVSHPLPRIFGKKKSAPVLRDVPLDESLVPVLDAGPSGVPKSDKPIGGRKRDEELTTRQCMCCDNTVRFPRGLKVFRCTNCLTINDLEPYVKETRDPKPSTYPNQQPGPRPILPLSVERSRAIIDRCLITYLEARCRRGDTPTSPGPSVLQDPFVRRDPTTDHATLQPSPRFAQSPTETPETASATLKSQDDFQYFSYSNSLSPNKSPSRPKTAGSVYTAPHEPPVPPMPPLPPIRRPPPPPGSHSSPLPMRPGPPNSNDRNISRYDRVKVIFKPLEDYMLSSFGDYNCLNTSFSTVRQHVAVRRQSESAIKTPPSEPVEGVNQSPIDLFSQMDAKTLLLGDFAENGDWWTGRVTRNRSDKSDKRGHHGSEGRRLTTSRSPHIDWDQLTHWYDVIHAAGLRWRDRVANLRNVDREKVDEHIRGPANAKEIDEDIAEARLHAERALLKITENILKRPTRPLMEPDHIRFLLVILANPSLYPSNRASGNRPPMPRTPSGLKSSTLAPPSTSRMISPQKSPGTPVGNEPGQHAGILKRIFGLIANSSENCHRCLTNWFSRMPEQQFIKMVDLVARFVTYRLSRRKSRPRSVTPQDGGLIPDLSGSARNTFAQLQSATGLSGSGSGAGRNKMPQMETISVVDYSEDWQLRAAAKIMAMLFAANNTWQTKKGGLTPAQTSISTLSRPRTKMHGQLLPTSDFYNTLLDYNDLVADFKAWESKKAKFTFCQYPLFLSMGAKIRIMEYDARRQMEIMAREAYFDSVTTRRSIDGYFHLRVRRECMVDDSLKQISGAVGSGPEELKKGLKVHFTDEEGVDAGGLRKEWFLTVVRDIFDPNHGMFLYDDDSGFCYFNPSSFETSDQYYLVGALLGLAIYNSTILDVALPPFAFRKLLASAPPSAQNPALPSSSRTQVTYTLEDLAEWRPVLAKGLRDLLEYNGDVEATYCRDFVASVERYGVVTDTPLIPGGEAIPVTNENRREYVDAYVRYLLDTSVARQFEPFKRGFFTVCAGNALSLFRAEEIELMVRGSDEALDVDSLKAVAVYENWREASPPHKPLPNPAEQVPVISWFWECFRSATPEAQRKLLGFITGSDRIPAVGATNLILRIVCGGDGTAGQGEAGGKEKERFPIARTCFNMLVLWGYESKAKLEEKLWRAVAESEGFGLK
ncbi:HECT-domain-containing protein [Aureobasidium pullulans]|nr:HECT-domain-containing protein [Aureobasidium pullulans]